MSEPQQALPLPSGKRPETGPMQFGDDHCGVFIRGDNALWTAELLKLLLRNDSRPIEHAPLYELVELLKSCRVGQ